MGRLEPARAAELIRGSSSEVVTKLNAFTSNTFRTRGGRMGSGMGLLLEGLWGYTTSQVISSHGIEISWLVNDQYNDYAVTAVNEDWDPVTRNGELLRIEAKTMNLGADETKGHFAELVEHIDPNDLLLVMLWRWSPIDGTNYHVAPQVLDVFLDRAQPLAKLRDALHEARGGSFVDPKDCPDGCPPDACPHAGEPLNANRKRERISGPESTRTSPKVSHANNFGGLKRMLAVRSSAAQQVRDSFYASSPVCKKYIDFMDDRRLKGL